MTDLNTEVIDDAVIDAEIEAINFELEQLTEALLHEAMAAPIDVSTLVIAGTDFDPVRSLFLSL